MDTLYLDPSSWDLALDAAGNIAKASRPYALAQDAASAIKTFVGDCYYDQSLGLPYFTEILGQRPPAELLKAKFAAAALTVPGVVAAEVFLTLTGRELGGQVQITDSAGVISTASF